MNSGGKEPGILRSSVSRQVRPGHPFSLLTTRLEKPSRWSRISARHRRSAMADDTPSMSEARTGDYEEREGIGTSVECNPEVEAKFSASQARDTPLRPAAPRAEIVRVQHGSHRFLSSHSADRPFFWRSRRGSLPGRSSLHSIPTVAINISTTAPASSTPLRRHRRIVVLAARFRSVVPFGRFT